MGRVACLRVSDLPLAAILRAHPEWLGQPLAVADGPSARASLLSLSSEALSRGLRLGSSVAQARAACPELRIQVSSPALEAAARDTLLDVALSFSPRAALAPRCSGAFAREAVVHVDASGLSSLFPTERGLAAAMAARAANLGLVGDVAIASSQGLSLLAARRLDLPGAHATTEDSPLREGRTEVLAPGSERKFLAPLPLDLLGPSDALVEALGRFGIRTLRELLALPERGLGTRLGREALELVALARGEEVRAVLPVCEDLGLVESLDLEFPVERLEPLGFVLQGLLSRLCERLETRHLACGGLELELTLDRSGAPHRGEGHDVRRVGLSAATLDLRTLQRLVGRSLEARPPTAPVVAVRLEATGEPLERDQLDLFRPAGPSPAALGRTLNELRTLCGGDRVGTPRVADDHHPDAFGLEPFRTLAPAPATAAPPPRTPTPPGLRALRPPVPAQVHLQGGHPAELRSAIASGTIERMAGPWRTTGGWWSPERRFAFDSYDVQVSDGSVVRLRRDHVARAWEIDGIYD